LCAPQLVPTNTCVRSLTKMDSATWHEAEMSPMVSTRSTSTGLRLCRKSSLRTSNPRHTLAKKGGRGGGQRLGTKHAGRFVQTTWKRTYVLSGVRIS